MEYLIACSVVYLVVLFGGIPFRHLFLRRWGVVDGWELDGRGDTESSLYIREHALLLVVIVYIIPGPINIFHLLVGGAVQEATQMKPEEFLHWYILSPFIWHLIPMVFMGVRYRLYLRWRQQKITGWLNNDLPVTKKEVEEYVRLVTDFSELLIEVNQWRDVLTAVEWQRREIRLSGDTLQIDIVFPQFQTKSWGRYETTYTVSIPTRKWRELRKLFLEGMRLQAEVVRQRMVEREMQAVFDTEEEKRRKEESHRREKLQVADLLDGEPIETEKVKPRLLLETNHEDHA